MNLFLFNDNDSAARFGIGTYLHELIHALKGTAIRVHIVHLHAPRPEFEIEKTDDPDSEENWYIPEVRNHHTFDGDIQKMEDYYRNVIYLLRLYNKNTTELVFHFNFNQCYTLVKGLKSTFDCKTVATIHFMKWALEFQGNLQKLRALKSKPEDLRSSFEQLYYTTDEYEGLFYKEVDRVIALSQYTKKLLCGEYQIDSNRISVIPNGLKDIKTGMESKRDVLRKRWNIPKHEFLLLFVGRLNTSKGLTFLIEAFRKVLNKVPDCRLMIVGNGNIEPYIRASKNICARISFTGFLDKNEIHELYQIADIGVLPSLTEQCSYVIMEMMMHSLPVVTSAAPGLNEMTEDGFSSLQVPVIEHPE